MPAVGVRDVVGYTMDTLYFGWLDNPVEIDPDVQFPQFKHIDSLLYDCSMNYTAGARRSRYLLTILFDATYPAHFIAL